MNKELLIKTLGMIAQDMSDDAKNFDGKEFNGRNVATYFGNHGAAIATIADIVKQIVEERGAK
jgi:hypothetical protein